MKKQNLKPIASTGCPVLEMKPSVRAEAIAVRLEAGAATLAEFAATLSESDWEMRVPTDGRKIGVVVHHVASLYPIGIQLAKTVATGQPITDLTWDAVAAMNRDHARDYDGIPKEAALTLLAANSATAAAAIRALTDEELDRSAPVSLDSDAPLTCQFMLENYAVRHSYHHLARMKQAITVASEPSLNAAVWLCG